jgi:hypothetical protein
MNALGHMTAGLVSQRSDLDMRFLRYENADGGIHPAISQWPFIMLAAKNSGQILRLREELRIPVLEGRVIYNDFVDAMIGTSAEDQLSRTKAAREADLEFYGAVAFGSASILDSVTKRFSLFRSEHAQAVQAVVL